MSSTGTVAPAAPLVTIGLLTHCRERYVRDALRGVLAQTYSPLQIVISDDASTDSTPAILREELSAYRGPHAIKASSNARNMGIKNYNQLMKLAEGDLIVVAHDDDISHPDRVERIVAAWRQSGASLVSSNGIRIAEDGSELGPFVAPGTPKTVSAEDLVTKGWNAWLFGGSLAWERKVFEMWGPLNSAKSAISTDWILPFRASLMGGIAIVNEPLLKIRRHSGSKAAGLFGDGSDRLARHEINLANSLSQFYYMLDTLAEPHTKELVPSGRSETLRRLLLQSIFERASEWRLCRNRLLAEGKRARWLPLA